MEVQGAHRVTQFQQFIVRVGKFNSVVFFVEFAFQQEELEGTVDLVRENMLVESTEEHQGE